MPKKTKKRNSRNAQARSSLARGSASSVEANFDRQERLVSALYRFHEGQQDNEHNCKYRPLSASKHAPYRSIHLPSVDTALTEILAIFGQPRVHVG